MSCIRRSVDDAIVHAMNAGDDDVSIQLARELGVPVDVLEGPYGPMHRNPEFTGESFRKAGWRWYATGSPLTVFVGVSSEEVAVAMPEVRWPHPHIPVTHAGDIVTQPRSHAELADWLGAHIATVAERRRASFRDCIYCHVTNPPERMMSTGECHGCAEKHGVVF